MIARFADLPIPGPVVGLVLLLIGLEVRARRTRNGAGPALRSTATGLLTNLGLLFVPAGVGVVTQLDTLAANWLPVLVAVVVSTTAGLVVTGVVMQRLARPDPDVTAGRGAPDAR